MQAGDYVHEVEKAVQNQMKVAFTQTSAQVEVQGRGVGDARIHPRQEPAVVPGLIESVDSWVATQVGKAEKKVAEKLGADEEEA